MDMNRPTYMPSRISWVNRFTDGNLAVLNGVSYFVVTRPCRLLNVLANLRSLGATSGATVVDVKRQVNGAGAFTSLLTTTISIAYNAALNYAKGVLTGASGEPSGVPLAAGDVLRVDVTAIPGTTSAGLTVDLELAETDV